MIESPWWCQDDSCECLRKSQECDMGGSQFCLGKMIGERIRTAHSTTHTNDLHFCIRTPFRGVVMLEMNAGDMQWILKLSLWGLKQAGHSVAEVLAMEADNVEG